ncbi:hypothetical protein Pelo_15503 [Pelomyxa schiedti]|nr:hypothetical protein Pelo_15503 [Pelomyxa schiedti]
MTFGLMALLCLGSSANLLRGMTCDFSGYLCVWDPLTRELTWRNDPIGQRSKITELCGVSMRNPPCVLSGYDDGLVGGTVSSSQFRGLPVSGICIQHSLSLFQGELHLIQGTQTALYAGTWLNDKRNGF